MITFKIDNIEISYSDLMLDEYLIFELLRNNDTELGTFDNPLDVEGNHLLVDEGWSDMDQNSIELMHKYVDNMIPCNKFVDFISNNELFNYFDFEKGLFTCEVIFNNKK